MKNFAPFALLLLVGCAVPPKEVAVNAPAPAASAPRVPLIAAVDQDCASLARYARSVAELRDAGVALQDVNLLLPFPTTFHGAPVIREVYNRADVRPAAGEANSYNVCKTQTFEVMVAALKKADEALVAAEADRIKAELAKKKAKPAAKLKLDKGDKK
jgi:hypothetical protein